MDTLTTGIDLDGHAVPVTYTDTGTGRPTLLLHGGGGVPTVAGLADRLAAGARVLVPWHPGFDGTPRPPHVRTPRDLARLYAALLAHLDLDDVTVVGNSLGGWVAAEIAALADPRVRRVVLVDAVGLDLPDTPVVDFFGLTPDQVIDLSYARPEVVRARPPAPGQPARMAANRDPLRVYGGETMADPGLRSRLAAAAVPVLVVWGAADRIVPVEHAHAFGAALPDARVAIIDDAGHLPQLEAPDTLVDLITTFAA